MLFFYTRRIIKIAYSYDNYRRERVELINLQRQIYYANLFYQNNVLNNNQNNSDSNINFLL